MLLSLLLLSLLIINNNNIWVKWNGSQRQIITKWRTTNQKIFFPSKKIIMSKIKRKTGVKRKQNVLINVTIYVILFSIIFYFLGIKKSILQNKNVFWLSLFYLSILKSTLSHFDTNLSHSDQITPWVSHYKLDRYKSCSFQPKQQVDKCCKYFHHDLCKLF